MKYEKLFEKGKIGKLTIKNRIVMPPMGTGFAAASGEASEEITRYYEERAKGGVGLIITEVCRVDELSGVAQPCQLRATDMDVIPSFTRMVDRVHAYGTKMFMHHPGNEAFPITLHGNPVIGPSPVMCKTVGVVPKEMTTAEVEAMVKCFIKGAVIAKTAGFDGVEVHAAHGYLVNQFMSPHTNHRTDKYGGDFACVSPQKLSWVFALPAALTSRSPFVWTEPISGMTVWTKRNASTSRGTWRALALPA